jgi:dTDP-4-amino-4,6-dideoxygalactose transaminase
LRDIEPERDEVLIPAFTCYSVPSSIVQAGLKVRLCDSNPHTFDFDFKQLSRILSPHSAPQGVNKPNQRNKLSKPNKPTSRLLSIIPIHLFGIPSDIERIRNLVPDPKVTIVEDAAQAMGVEWRGKKLGTFGDISFFSLGRGKALSSVEGGIILTDRTDIANRLGARIASVSSYRTIELMGLFFKAISLSLFVHPSLFWFPKAIPSLKLGKTVYDPHFNMRKMSTLQAGLLRGWQRKLRHFKKAREENSTEWTSITGTNNLNNYVTRNRSHPGLIRFPVNVDDRGLRKRILKMSDEMGLGIMPTYPNSIDRIPEMRTYFWGQTFPMAKQLADNLITLPTHSFVTQRDKRQIAALISQITHYEP